MQITGGRLYNYYFDGLEKPLSIPAFNKEESRRHLPEEIINNPLYHGRRVVHESSSSLVTGISKIQRNGETYTWNGQQWEKTHDTETDD